MDLLGNGFYIKKWMRLSEENKHIIGITNPGLCQVEICLRWEISAKRNQFHVYSEEDIFANSQLQLF